MGLLNPTALARHVPDLNQWRYVAVSGVEGAQSGQGGSSGEMADVDPPTVVADAAQQEARLAARRRLQAALSDAELLPETTSDERPRSGMGNRDQELLANLPPHHG
ncbi:MAG TPA: hypothetical protein PLB21_00120 [Actinomycetota bacterium]|nr:hypothetical protein [Actinomycetota bacterium]